MEIKMKPSQALNYILMSLFMLYLPSPILPDEPAAKPGLEENLKKQGLVDIQMLDKEIPVQLKYTTTDNFMKADAYGDLDKCYLRPEVSKMLIKAQSILKKEHPELTLLIFDCVRPRNIQRKMWKIVKGTPLQQYVADPEKGSIHNYGAAVDLTLLDESGKEKDMGTPYLGGVQLDMGTPFDFFGELAQPRLEDKFLKEKKLTEQQIKNRKMLRKAMEEAGFKQLDIEWWHFNAYPADVIEEKYSIIE
jgi:D-alanyl-D-alanine dipeptidase